MTDNCNFFDYETQTYLSWDLLINDDINIRQQLYDNGAIEFGNDYCSCVTLISKYILKTYLMIKGIL